MTLFGYEGYTIKIISSYFFNTAKNSYISRFVSDYWVRNSNKTLIRPVEPDSPYKELVEWHSVKGLNNLELFTSKKYMPKEGETLYFDKSCTIPRIKCEGRWKRTIKLFKADVVVVPEIEKMDSHDSCAIFVDSSRNAIWILDNVNNLAMPCSVGDTVESVIHNHRKLINGASLTDSANYTEIMKASDAVCIFVGPLLTYQENQQYIWNIIDGIYPKIVFENDLLQDLGTEEEKFTADTVQALTELLSSRDSDSVHQGMRVLANMDYTHYPAITTYILDKTESNWEHFKPYNSAVKFMMESLGYKAHYSRNVFSNVSREEFALAKNILVNIIKKDIDGEIQSIRRTTNLQIPFEYTFDLVYPEPVEQQDSDTFEE